MTIVAVAAIALVGYWFVDEYLDADEPEDAVRGTGRRAASATESAARGSRVAVVGLAGLGATVGFEMLQLAAELNAILGGAPVILGHLVAGVLGFLGVKGLLTIQQYGFLFITVTVIALVLRFGDNGQEVID